MKMTRLEKSIVNRPQKAIRNINRIEERLQILPVNRIKDVLELGCGVGMVSAHLAVKYGMHVIGTDDDPEEIELAKKRNEQHPNLTFQKEDATHLSFNDDCFDLVISQNVFHHIPKWEIAIREISRVLSPEGYLIWLDLVFPSWLKRLTRPLAGKFGIYTQQEIEQEFRQSGFEPVYTEKVSHGPFNHSEKVYERHQQV